eukprot:3361990-Alexandrium_andersonii.AAC.1
MIGRDGATARGTARSRLPPMPGRSLRLRTALGRRLARGAGLRLRTVSQVRVAAGVPRAGQ